MKLCSFLKEIFTKCVWNDRFCKSQCQGHYYHRYLLCVWKKSRDMRSGNGCKWIISVYSTLALFSGNYVCKRQLLQIAAALSRASAELYLFFTSREFSQPMLRQQQVVDDTESPTSFIAVDRHCLTPVGLRQSGQFQLSSYRRPVLDYGAMPSAKLPHPFHFPLPCFLQSLP